MMFYASPPGYSQIHPTDTKCCNHAYERQPRKRQPSTFGGNQEKRGYRSRAFQGTQVEKPGMVLLHLDALEPKARDFDNDSSR
jgi:hypothetical protein